MKVICVPITNKELLVGVRSGKFLACINKVLCENTTEEQLDDFEKQINEVILVLQEYACSAVEAFEELSKMLFAAQQVLSDTTFYDMIPESEEIDYAGPARKRYIGKCARLRFP